MPTNPIRRVPPPPPIAVNDPTFNRWLHDLTAFLTESGIDTGAIPGYDNLVATVVAQGEQIVTNTDDIAGNTTDIANNEANIAINAANIATNAANISTNAAGIATLAARSQVRNGTAAPAAGLGINGDWFADTVGKHIHVKSGGVWVLIV